LHSFFAKGISETVMRKYFLLLFMISGFFNCSKFPDKRKTYYFYDAKHNFQRKDEITDSLFCLDYWIHVPPHY
jgi:hypothetical protein